MPLLCLSAVAGEVRFNRDIRPILSDHCYQCHGFDDAERKAGLRLDERIAATSRLPSGHAAIVPGSAAESALVRRIRDVSAEQLMPPPHVNKPLSAEQVSLLATWIDQGAYYEKHWSLVPPQKPRPPSVANASWPSNEIDQFILARLEDSNLESSVAANRATLLRRLSFDLTGLPPTAEELDAFVNDSRPDYYERAVNRLLSSPRYGEHRARYWLDAARYGDTHGMARDDERSLWPYRDWVIRAFNDNMPFDDFTIRQLAGDLLPKGSLSDLVATGFVRCNVSTAEGGSIDEELVVNYAKDRVETMATVWMGLTLGCAACHDHKYDPLSQKEYYQLAAFFSGLREEPMNGNALAPDPVVAVLSPDQAQQLADLTTQRTEIQNEYARHVASSQVEDFNRWLAKSASEYVRDHKPDWKESPWYESRSFKQRNNTAIYFDEEFSPEESVDLQGESQGWQERKAMPEQGILVRDDNVAKFYYREWTGSLPTTRTLHLKSNESTWKPVRWKVWLNGRLVYFKQFRQFDVPFEVDIPLSSQAGTNTLLVKASHFGGPLRATIFLEPLEEVADRERETLEAIAAASRHVASPPQHVAALDYYSRHVWSHGKEFSAANARIEESRYKLEAIIPVSMICREMEQPRETYLLQRGLYDKPLERVDREVPLILPPFDGPRDRLGLAQWLVDGRHPLTARVAVNRIWAQFFGVGLVQTSEDFGSQGEWPSHPELLDWLACDFQENDWNVKRLIRKIVTSATYRQSSRGRSELLTADPQNRLLARGPRFRLDAEVIRDQALFLGGLLVEEQGGRGVKPPQPGGLWQAVSQPNSTTARFVADKGTAARRRSIYTFWKRTAPPAILQTFDAPTRESCIVRRERTNTPLQALALMNDEQFFAAAKGIAQRIIEHDVLTDEARLEWAFRLVTARDISPSELNQLTAQLQRARTYYRAHPGEAEELTGTQNAEEAAWVLLANTLLNLSEVITKE